MSAAANIQQIEHGLRILEQQREAQEQLATSLRALRDRAPLVVRILSAAVTPADGITASDYLEVETAVTGYLTAKLKLAILDQRGFEAQIKYLESQRSGIVRVGGILPG